MGFWNLVHKYYCKIIKLQLQQNNLDYDMEKKATTFECKDNTEKLRHG